MNWRVEFYQDRRGRIPVQDFISEQSAKAKSKILWYLDLLTDRGLSLGQPFLKKIEGSDIWELRIQFGSSNYRILYVAFRGHRFVLLHAFLKKSAKTPKKELAMAENRLFDYVTRTDSQN